MAKPTGPLLSLGATGTIASTMTFGTWRGQSYVRQRVIPANPQTVAQTLTRDVFRSASEIWLRGPALLEAPWTAAARGRPVTNRNLFQGSYVRFNRGEADLQAMIFSPGARGGLPPVSIDLTPGSEQIEVGFTNPAAPEGWVLESAIAAAILDGDPADPPSTLMIADEDDTTQNSVTLTGLTASELYVVGAWLRWTKPDGTTAYSVSLSDTATPTA